MTSTNRRLKKSKRHGTQRNRAVWQAVMRFMDTAAYAASQSARSAGQLSQEDGELKAKLGKLAALAAEIKSDCEAARAGK